MKDILDELESQPTYSNKEIFTEIWLSPKKVLQYIDDHAIDDHVSYLLVLAGVSSAFERASMRNMGDDLPLIGVILLSLVIGAAVGWISYYIFAALLNWTGRMIDGKGNSESIVRMIAYAMIPSVIGLVFLIPQIGIYGNELFQESSNLDGAGLFGNIIFYGSAILQLILNLWSVVLLVIGLSITQKFSIVKSIFNILLPIIIFVVPLLLLFLSIS